MKYLSTQDIPLKDIDASDRLRAVNEDWVKGISESFANIGQKEPIEVVAQTKGKNYRLVAGGHRFAAAELCGWETIRAEIKQTVTDNFDLEVRLHEIDENLIRNELNALDRAVFLGERQRIYEAMYPETAGGVAGGKARQGSANDIVSFADATAEKIEVSGRTVQRYVTIFKNLSPEIRARISGTELAKKQGELYKLTRFNEEQQRKIISACSRNKNPAQSVSVAAQELDGRETTQTDHEHQALEQLKSKFSNSTQPNKAKFLIWLSDLGIVTSFDEEQLA